MENFRFATNWKAHCGHMMHLQGRATMKSSPPTFVARVRWHRVHGLMALVVVDMTVNVALEFLVQWKPIGKQLGLGKGRIQSMTAHMRYSGVGTSGEEQTFQGQKVEEKSSLRNKLSTRKTRKFLAPG